RRIAATVSSERSPARSTPRISAPMASPSGTTSSVVEVSLTQTVYTITHGGHQPRAFGAYVGSVLHDELAVHRVLARYCHTIDDGAFDEFGALWADDAEFVLRGTVTRGRDAIRDAIEAMQPAERRGRHLTLNAVVDVG